MMGQQVQVRVDAAQWTGKLEHKWNYVGYDECNYTHSPGGMALIEKFGRLEKPYYMRAHHMLCTGNLHGTYKWGSTNVYLEDEQGNPIYDFETIDMMVDIWLKNGCKPFFEIGFMPRDLADTRDAGSRGFYDQGEYRRIGWAMPPKDYQKWYDLIYALVSHLKDRYGVKEIETWYFEMWNEPDIFYWRGTHEEFCKLFDYTEAAVHAAMPTARFGGPTTTGAMGENANATRFLDGFLDHIRNGVNHYSGEKGTRIDFTTFHTKGGLYDANARAKKQIPSVKELLTNVATQCAVIKKYGYEDLECVLSEADPDGWAAGGRYDNFNLNFRNTEYYASYVMSGYKNLFDLAEKLGMDIRPLAWAFMFEGERCFEGTRAFTTQGIDKAVFNLFKMFARMGEQKVLLTTTRDLDPMTFADLNGTAEGPEIDGWATMDGEDKMQILLYCHHDDWDRKETFDIDLQLANLPMAGRVRVKHLRIDDQHSNPYAQWVNLGKPNWPSEGQYAAIKARDGLEYCEAPREELVHEGGMSMRFTLPTHGISLITVEKI